MNTLREGPVATILIVIIALVGAVVVVLSATDSITDPQLRLSFDDYIKAVGVAAGLLAIGRGLKAGGIR